MVHHLFVRPGICTGKLKKETNMSKLSGQHQEIVKKLLDTKAVDFGAVGKVVAELGPSLSLADEPGDFFCGTMRTFFHCYRIDTTATAVAVEPLAEVRAAAAGELRR